MSSQEKRLGERIDWVSSVDNAHGNRKDRNKSVCYSIALDCDGFSHLAVNSHLLL